MYMYMYRTLVKEGPCGTPYIGPRLGDGSIFEVSVSHLDVKECPVQAYVTHALFIIRIVAAATIDFSLIQAW